MDIRVRSPSGIQFSIYFHLAILTHSFASIGNGAADHVQLVRLRFFPQKLPQFRLSSVTSVGYLWGTVRWVEPFAVWSYYDLNLCNCAQFISRTIQATLIMNATQDGFDLSWAKGMSFIVSCNKWCRLTFFVQFGRPLVYLISSFYATDSNMIHEVLWHLVSDRND